MQILRPKVDKDAGMQKLRPTSGNTDGNTTTTVNQQMHCKFKAFAWAFITIGVIVLSVIAYDPEHKVLFSLVPIAVAIPGGLQFNKNIRKIRELKEQEKVYIVRHK